MGGRLTVDDAAADVWNLFKAAIDLWKNRKRELTR